MAEEIRDIHVYKNVYTINVSDEPAHTSGKYRFELPADAHKLAMLAFAHGLYDGIASWSRPPQERSEQVSRQACTHRLEGYAEPYEGKEGTNDPSLYRRLFTSAYLPARRSVYQLLASDWQLAARFSHFSQESLMLALCHYVEEHRELTTTLDQDQVIELPLPFLLGEDL